MYENILAYTMHGYLFRGYTPLDICSQKALNLLFFWGRKMGVCGCPKDFEISLMIVHAQFYDSAISVNALLITYKEPRSRVVRLPMLIC